MEREAANYGVQREHGSWPAPYPPIGGAIGGAMSAREERTWST